MSLPFDSPEFWNEKYMNNLTGWDLKGPNPVFVEIINKNELIQPGNLLIPGCGKGYDAIAAAKAGFSVTAVDFSHQALIYAKNLAEKEGVKINFLEADIFHLNDSFTEKFDAVYEYTTYCAINPERRKEYAEIISSLILPGGKFLAILFPVEEKETGPPFGINIIEFYNNFSKFLKLDFSNRNVNSIKPRKGREVIQFYIKPD